MKTTIRRSRLWAVALFIGVAGCGFNGCEGGTGHLHDRCRNWTDSHGLCDPGLYCAASGTCEICGGDGEHCCTHEITFPTCNGDLLCNGSTCTSTCGHEGERACEGPGTTFFCADGLMHDASMICRSMTADSRCIGSYPIHFWLEYPNGCASLEIDRSISGPDAQEDCAREFAAGAGATGAEVRFDEAPTTYYYCQYQPPPLDCRADIATHDGEVLAYSPDDAQRCLQATFPGYSFVVHESDSEECPDRECG